jgi:hypothetical protein
MEIKNKGKKSGKSRKTGNVYLPHTHVTEWGLGVFPVYPDFYKGFKFDSSNIYTETFK